MNDEHEFEKWTNYEPGLLIPQQENTDDCGAYVLQFAKRLSMGQDFADLKSEDIDFYRKLMMLELSEF